MEPPRVGERGVDKRIYIYICMYVCMYVLWHGVTLIPWPPQEPTHLRFPVLPGIPKPMIPYPLLWEGAVRTVGSHLGRIPNCSEVPDPPPPQGTALPGAPPRNPPPQGASGWHQFFNTMANFGTKFTDCGTRTSVYRDCWLLSACCYFLEASECNLMKDFEGGPQITPLAPSSTTCVAEFSWKLCTNHHVERQEAGCSTPQLACQRVPVK